MKRALLPSLVLLPVLLACRTTPDYDAPLAEGAPALIPLGPGDEVPDFSREWEAREEIRPALENSLFWMRRPHARRFFPQAGISYERALASLEHFQALLESTPGPTELQVAIERDFTIYRSAGWNGRGGGVRFTAYCTPILPGRLERDETFRWPLYALPPDLVKDRDGTVLGWETALGRIETYPSRGAIESGGLLENRELELVWLANPLDAYIAHVNGSAFIALPDGSLFRLGYAGKNGRPYRSLGRELEDDGKIPRGQASLQSIRAWAASAPEEELFEYLHRNASFVFFTPIDGNPHGSLDVEVTAERSLATDKTLFPRAALVFVDASPPKGAKDPAEGFHRFLFDQDTGGAIRTAGRADIYLGIGDEAVERAGRVKAEGQLYYLFRKEGTPAP
ncbi:MAG: MltA domain-containing protein [Planctomycetota bacterium]